MESKKYKIVALMGQAGAGKDSILRALIKRAPHLHEIVSCTTRPPREGEVDGINYHFLTSDEFSEQICKGNMIEATVFRDWCYGTSFDNLNMDKVNIGVFNPAGVNLLMDMDNVNVMPIYIIASDKERLLRQLNREHNPDVKEIIRRFSADEIDFKDIIIPDTESPSIGFMKYYEDFPIYLVYNENPNMNTAIQRILDIVCDWSKEDNPITRNSIYSETT